MNFVLKSTGMLAFLFAALAPASNSFADMVTLNLTSAPAGRIVNVTFIDNANVSKTFNTYAGQLGVTVSGSTSSSVTDGDYIVFCTELAQHIYFNQSKDYQVVDLTLVPNPGPTMTQAQADGVRRLFSYGLAANPNQFDGSGSNAAKDFAAAFQIAVWEISRDYGNGADFSLSAGDFVLNTASASVLNLATNLLANFTSASPYPNLLGLQNEGRQDQIVLFQSGTVVIPEPTTAALWALGAVCLAGGAFRRRSNMAS